MPQQVANDLAVLQQHPVSSHLYHRLLYRAMFLLILDGQSNRVNPPFFGRSGPSDSFAARQKYNYATGRLNSQRCRSRSAICIRPPLSLFGSAIQIYAINGRFTSTDVVRLRVPWILSSEFSLTGSSWAYGHIDKWKEPGGPPVTS